MIVLGLDPGATTGWALVDCQPQGATFLDGGGVRELTNDARGLLMLLTAVHTPALVAVETVRAVFSRERFGAGMATALVDAARIEGRILEAARARGIETATCTAADWRKALVGNGRAADALVKTVLSLRMKLPRCSAHVRDAVGVALFCAARANIDGMRVRRAGGAR